MAADAGCEPMAGAMHEIYSTAREWGAQKMPNAMLRLSKLLWSFTAIRKLRNSYHALRSWLILDSDMKAFMNKSDAVRVAGFIHRVMQEVDKMNGTPENGVRVTVTS